MPPTTTHALLFQLLALLDRLVHLLDSLALCLQRLQHVRGEEFDTFLLRVVAEVEDDLGRGRGVALRRARGGAPRAVRVGGHGGAEALRDRLQALGVPASQSPKRTKRKLPSKLGSHEKTNSQVTVRVRSRQGFDQEHRARHALLRQLEELFGTVHEREDAVFDGVVRGGRGLELLVRGLGHVEVGKRVHLVLLQVVKLLAHLLEEVVGHGDESARRGGGVAAGGSANRAVHARCARQGAGKLGFLDFGCRVLCGA
jgi:hypothetical protein